MDIPNSLSLGATDIYPTLEPGDAILTPGFVSTIEECYLGTVPAFIHIIDICRLLVYPALNNVK